MHLVKKIIRKVANALRKTANKLDESSIINVSALDINIKIHPSSKISENKIVLKSNCFISIDEKTQVDGSIFF